MTLLNFLAHMTSKSPPISMTIGKFPDLLRSALDESCLTTEGMGPGIVTEICKKVQGILKTTNFKKWITKFNYLLINPIEAYTRSFFNKNAA